MSVGGGTKQEVWDDLDSRMEGLETKVAGFVMHTANSAYLGFKNCSMCVCVEQDKAGKTQEIHYLTP